MQWPLPEQTSAQRAAWGVGAATQHGQDAGGEGLRIGGVEAGWRRHRADLGAGTAGGAAVQDLVHLDVEGLVERGSVHRWYSGFPAASVARNLAVREGLEVSGYGMDVSVGTGTIE
jgi:hypothetical protein